MVGMVPFQAGSQAVVPIAITGRAALVSVPSSAVASSAPASTSSEPVRVASSTSRHTASATVAGSGIRSLGRSPSSETRG